jgi:hypothetical protein
MITSVKIWKKYGISPATFEAVRPLLQAKRKSKHGRLFFDIRERDDFVLRCARNHILSFGGKGKDNAHILPFYRFLCLKFLTTPNEEALSEIHERNLATPKFGLGYYKKLLTRFLKRIPEELRPLVKKKGEPTKKQKGAYEMLLNVLGVIVAYNYPVWMDNFFSFIGDARSKSVIEAIVTTRGSRVEHQLALEEMSGQQWKNVAFDLYRSMFYDVGCLSDEDWRYYLGIIYPTDRRAKSRARGMTTNELRVLEGTNPHFQETLRTIAVGLQKKMLGTMAMKGEEFKNLHQYLGMYTKIGVATGDVEKPNTGGQFFQNISIVPSETKFKVVNAEIKGQVADGQA